MTMVERVARALAVNDGRDPDGPAWVIGVGEPYGVCWRDQYRDKARAAIQEMREPTEGMFDIGAEKIVDFMASPTTPLMEATRSIYQAMVDKAAEGGE